MKTKKPKTRSQLKKECWRLCSIYNRRRFADKNGNVKCYTCGKEMAWTESQAGHMIGGRNNAIIFCDEAIRPQCVGCNVFKRGNYGVFAKNFIKENGIAEYEKLEGISKLTVQLKSAHLEELIGWYKHTLGEMYEL